MNYLKNHFKILILFLVIKSSNNIFAQSDSLYMKNGYSIIIYKDSLGREILRTYNNEVGNPKLPIQFDTIHIFKITYKNDKQIIEYKRVFERIYWRRNNNENKNCGMDIRFITKQFREREIIRLEKENTNHNFETNKQ